MSNFNDFLKSKIDLLTNELIEKIQNDNPLATDIFLKKTFEIETALNVEKKKEILVFLSKGIETFRKDLYTYYTQPNYKNFTNGYDNSLISVHFLNLYRLEYDSLNKTLSDTLQEVDLVDYSDTSIKEKVIALKELGILDFLQKEFQVCQTSTNKLSEVVSFIIGENSRTIQSYINPMINEGTSQNNNPYTNTKLVEKTQNKLNIIGLNTPKKV
mgnify:CR=1 FL=1